MAERAIKLVKRSDVVRIWLSKTNISTAEHTLMQLLRKFEEWARATNNVPKTSTTTSDIRNILLKTGLPFVRYDKSKTARRPAGQKAEVTGTRKPFKPSRNLKITRVRKFLAFFDWNVAEVLVLIEKVIEKKENGKRIR